MKAELENKLYEKYPGIFRQKDMSCQETCMCWGISTGDGWYNLIDDLCDKIQKYIDVTGKEQVEAMQVKEKFGGLRFYIGGADDIVYNYIYEAESESYKTCEACGGKEDVSQTKGGWITTLCGECMNSEGED